MMGSEDLFQAASAPGGDHLLPYGAPGQPALGVDAPSTLHKRIRGGCYRCSQSREFATPSGGGHRVELHRLSDRPPEFGPAGDRIPAVARCGFGIPLGSSPPG